MLRFKVRAEGLPQISANLNSATEKAKHIVALQVRNDTEPFVPALTGSLSGRTRVNQNLVIYPGPSSRYLYYGKLMVDPNTGSAWAQKGTTKVLTDKNLVFNHSMHGQAQDHWFEASKAENLKKWLRVAQKAVKSNV